MAKEYIKTFEGIILGSMEDMGDRIEARDFGGRLLGWYDKGTDTTRDFYGRILYQGNAVSSLITHPED